MEVTMASAYGETSMLQNEPIVSSIATGTEYLLV